MRNCDAIIFILLIGIIGCNNRVKENPGSTSALTREIDKVRITALDGKSISLKQYYGKTIFINFWATWCKPCIKEMPSIKEAQNILQNEKIIFLLASSESAEQIKEFSTGHDYKFNYVRIDNPEEINVQALPTTFIFNPEGSLVFSETGFREWDEKNNIDLILKIVKSK